MKRRCQSIGKSLHSREKQPEILEFQTTSNYRVPVLGQNTMWMCLDFISQLKHASTEQMCKRVSLRWRGGHREGGIRRIEEQPVQLVTISEFVTLEPAIHYRVLLQRCRTHPRAGQLALGHLQREEQNSIM